MEDKLQVRILTPEKTLWDGYANAISSKNIEGDFDILPGHANFFSLVENDPVIVRREAGDEEFKFDNPVMIYVEDDVVSIYANVGASLKRKSKKEED